MKDFDAQRHEREANTEGRSFQIGGETVVARASVSPDVWVDYFDRRRTNATSGEPMSNRQYLDFLDDHIRAVIEPESVDAWQHARAEANPAITLADIDGVIDFLWELQSARPTGQPGESSTGSPTSTPETSSTADSSSALEEVSTV